MGQWKAIRPRPGKPLELYDLSSDLGETRDVAEEHPEIAAKMEGILSAAHIDPPPQFEPETPPNRAFR